MASGLVFPGETKSSESKNQFSLSAMTLYVRPWEYFSTFGKFVNGGWRNMVLGSEGVGSMGYMICAESLRDKRDLEVEAEKACEEAAGSIELDTV